MSAITSNMGQFVKINGRLKPRPRKIDRQLSALLEETTALGIVVAGVALIEVALLPGALIGGIAVIAPNYLIRHRKALSHPPSEFRNKNQKKFNSLNNLNKNNSEFKHFFGLQRSFAKTVTFRILSSSLDFTWNYALLGDVAVAAGLSGFGFIASSTFYFIHESSWNQLKSLSVNKPIKLLPIKDIKQVSNKTLDEKYWWDLQISPALAKTFTFRSMATVAEFTTNYYVVRDIPMAAALSAFGFFCGPFIYYAHEKLWEKYSRSNDVIASPLN